MKHFCIILFLIFAACSSKQKDNQPLTRTARLVFVGDVMSHEPQVTAARRVDSLGDVYYDYAEVFDHFEPIFGEADVVIANLETTLRNTPPYTGYPAFAAPAELAFAMQRSGIDIVTIANNHTCDKGSRGIRSTLNILDSAGLRHTGAFIDTIDRAARNPLYFNAGGLQFALLTYTYGTNGVPVPRGMVVNPIDTALIARDISGICRDSIDCVIVSYHWGDEYRSKPNNTQTRLAAWTRDRGVDIVMGGHPHVIEPMEVHYRVDSLSDSTVVGATYYSLGNFVSNQRRRYTDGGMTAEIVVTKIGSGPVTYAPEYRLFWVYTPVVEGVMRYRVLPSEVADTMSFDANSRAQYELFMRDSRGLLSLSLIHITRLTDTTDGLC